MKISTYIDTRKPTADGTFCVYIYIRYASTRMYFSTGLYSHTKFEGREFPKTEENWRIKTAALTRKLATVEEFCYLHDNIPAYKLRNEISLLLGNQTKKQRTLYEYIEENAKTKRTRSTRETYLALANHVKAYAPMVTFETADKEWVKGFQSYLLSKMKINTAAQYLHNLASVFHWAIDNEWTQNYPFRRIKIETQRTRKRSLTLEQLIAVRDAKCYGRQNEYRDIFMLMFYLIGINAVDLLNIEGIDSEGRLTFHRHKTGRLYSIKVEPEAMEIIQKYKGEKHLLYPLDKIRNYKSYVITCNLLLRRIGQTRQDHKIGREWTGTAICADLTTYWARHTWASIAASLDIPKETIAHALGHAEYDTTDIYIDFDYRKVDIANRKVLDYVASLKPKDGDTEQKEEG